MCFYITLIVRGADSATVDHVLRGHGRQAKPINNISLREILVEGEMQYLTTISHCDCGTVLAPNDRDKARDRVTQAASLARKGWSTSKINRWLDDRIKADHKSEERQQAQSPDSISLWSRIVGDLVGIPGVQQAGLLLHFYSGDVEQEILKPSREIVGIQYLEHNLRKMRQDNIVMVVA